MNKRNEGLTKAKYSEFLADIIGACIISIGVGIWLYDYLKDYMMWFFIVGIPLHSWGMYKVHSRNR